MDAADERERYGKKIRVFGYVNVFESGKKGEEENERGRRLQTSDAFG